MALTPWGIKKHTTVLTNAQIKALPTTPITVVPAPGSGLVLIPVACSVEARFQNGAYTNIDDSPRLQLKLDTSSRVEVSGYFFPAASRWTARQFGSISRGDMATQAQKRLALDNDAYANKSLKLSMVNAALGALTGGHANNTLTVIIWYYIVQTPAAETVAIAPTTLDLTEGDPTDTLTATVDDQYGDEIDSPVVAWASDDTGVATVHPTSGLVTRIAEGTANVTASINGHTSNACVVTCEPDTP